MCVRYMSSLMKLYFYVSLCPPVVGVNVYIMGGLMTYSRLLSLFIVFVCLFTCLFI